MKLITNYNWEWSNWAADVEVNNRQRVPAVYVLAILGWGIAVCDRDPPRCGTSGMRASRIVLAGRIKVKNAKLISHRPPSLQDVCDLFLSVFERPLPRNAFIIRHRPFRHRP